MRGAFGKPNGTVARVNIGQVLMSIRCKEANKEAVIESLRRAKYKFPGRQKIIVSNKWGFTKLTKEEYLQMMEEKKIHTDGSYIKYDNGKGKLSEYFKRQERLRA
jgi:large subunit ribosomal protein L10e